MADEYSTYDAKARFSEIIRRVREGRSVYVTYRGKRVAEIRPIDQETPTSMEDRLRELQERGVVLRAEREFDGVRTPVRRPGALKRFLEERDQD
jgi:prevent-host-death family protein